ncbi:MAG: hypothetical protein ACREE6_16265, partial [Limisphaerales bacterium]
IAFGIRNERKNYMDAILEEGVRRGCGKSEMTPKIMEQASNVSWVCPKPPNSSPSLSLALLAPA